MQPAAESAPARVLPQLGRRRAVAEHDSLEDGCTRQQGHLDTGVDDVEQGVVDEVAASRSAARAPPTTKVYFQGSLLQLAVTVGRPFETVAADSDGCVQTVERCRNRTSTVIRALGARLLLQQVSLLTSRAAVDH